MIRAEKPNENLSMRYLSAFAIVFVILGHISGTHYGFLTFQGLFEFYSFHMPLFLFISGYFYNASEEQHPGRFLLKKVKSVLLPFYACTLFFLLLGTLLHALDLPIGHTFSFYEWIVTPWITLEPLTLAVATWYLTAFFICIIVHLFVHKAASYLIRKPLARELAVLLFYLAVGMAAAILNRTLQPDEAALVYLRSAVMLFFIQLGSLYKQHLEAHDRLGHAAFLGLIFGLRLLFYFLFKALDLPLTYRLYGLLDFDAAGVPFYIAGILGIAFWLRIAKIVAEYPKPVRPLVQIGRNTKYIMMFHLLGFFLLNLILYGIDALTKGNLLDAEAFSTQIYYTATDEMPPMILLYLAAGLSVSLFAAFLIRRIKALFRK